MVAGMKSVRLIARDAGWALVLAGVLVARPAGLGAQASTVVVVRHAEKADTTRDTGLSAVGVTRAEALRDALADFPLQAIYLSEYRRGEQTAAPTAVLFRLTPVVIPIHGDKTAQAEATAVAIRLMNPGSAALVVGHSNTVGMIIAALGGPAVPELCDQEYAMIFVLELPLDLPPRLLRASYGVPDPPEAVACHAPAPITETSAPIADPQQTAPSPP